MSLLQKKFHWNRYHHIIGFLLLSLKSYNYFYFPSGITRVPVFLNLNRKSCKIFHFIYRTVALKLNLLVSLFQGNCGAECHISSVQESKYFWFINLLLSCKILSVFPAHFSLRRHHYLNAWKWLWGYSIHTNAHFYPFVHDMLSGGLLLILCGPLRLVGNFRTTVLHLFIGVHNSNRGGFF